MVDQAGLHLKITRGPPFWWEIYRGDGPQWIERSQFGYLIESEARVDGEAALKRLICRETRAKQQARGREKHHG